MKVGWTTMVLVSHQLLQHKMGVPATELSQKWRANPLGKDKGVEDYFTQIALLFVSFFILNMLKFLHVLPLR